MRSHQNQTPSSSNQIYKPTCIYFHILTFLLVTWIQSSWLPNISPAFITVYPAANSLFFLTSINIKTCPCYLPFNTPLTPIYLLWLQVYAQFYNSLCEKIVFMCFFTTLPPTISWLHSSQTFFSSTAVLMSGLQTRVKRQLWERSKWTGEGKGDAHAGSSCETILVINERTDPNARSLPILDEVLRTWETELSHDTLGVNVISKGKYSGRNRWMRTFLTFGGWLKETRYEEWVKQSIMETKGTKTE